MKAPRYSGGILDGWLAAEQLVDDCTSYLCKRNSILSKASSQRALLSSPILSIYSSIVVTYSDNFDCTAVQSLTANVIKFLHTYAYNQTSILVLITCILANTFISVMKPQ